VRAANPDAFILYKPHPHVRAGHRKGAIREAAARCYADAVLQGGSLAALLGEIDELHALTSLSAAGARDGLWAAVLCRLGPDPRHRDAAARPDPRA
jgi:capsule polysaccharide export protein KpsC/LpsZ